MAIPDWECLLESSIVAHHPGHVGPDGGSRHTDAGGGVGACAYGEEQMWTGHCWSLLEDTHTYTHTSLHLWTVFDIL